MTQTSLRICVYNYKGGAGKTTLVVNLGAALARLNLKVLLVDLDAQCNTTQFYHDDVDGKTLKEDECSYPPASRQQEHMVLSDELYPTTFAASMDALVECQSQRDGEQNTLFQIFDKFFTQRDAPAAMAILGEGFERLHSCNPDGFAHNLWLLEGTPLIWKFEEEISSAFATPTDDKSLRQYGILAYVFEQYTATCEFDVILVDCGPSNSAIHKAAALACDYILPPCQAALYSAGSVHGLLSTVLPGRKGWFGLHRKITDHWRDPTSGRPREDEKEAVEHEKWLLPKSSPKLLPFLINNYMLEEKPGSIDLAGMPSPSASKKRTKKAATGEYNEPEVMKFSASQFVYTIQNFVYKECRWVEGSERQQAVDQAAVAEGRPRSKDDPLVVFETNCGKKVIPFAPASPIAMPVAEQAGRAFAELTLNEFKEYYDSEALPAAQLPPADGASGGAVSSSAASVASATAPAKQKKKRSQHGESSNHAGLVSALHSSLEAALENGSFERIFNKEVEVQRSRYRSLATWLNELLEKKKAALG